jgi:signal transduction histidine kinase
MSAIVAVLRVTLEPRAYLDLVYLVSRVWVGLVYLTLLVLGLTFGVGTLPFGVGLPGLILVLLAVRSCASFERDLAHRWLGITLRPMSSPWSSASSLWRRVLALVTDRTTWKCVAYLALQLPLGLVTYVIVGVLLAVVLSLVALPVLYALDAGQRAQDLTYSSTGPVLGQAAPAQPLVFAAAVLLGLALAIATLHVARAGVAIWGRMTSALLGMSQAEIALRAARAEAAVQQARAERSEQSRRQLIVNVSHELRTPIASIRGHVESMLQPTAGPSSDEEQQRYLEVVAHETERLGALVEDLLDVARADADELTLELAAVEVAGVVEHVHAALAPIARRERGITLVTNIAPGVRPALADRDRLSQILMNLVRNAIASTQEGGLVSIELSEAGDRIALAVEDTGFGIPPEELERIFERLYRTDASRSRATGGFGLGLSICRDLAHAMGGEITVRSEPGQGSRFTVLLRAA